MSTTATIPTILDSTTKQLLNLVLSYMSRFDDYMQLACDQNKPEELSNYFDHEYKQLDAIYHRYRLTPHSTVSAEERNKIRIICKYTERLAQTELFPES